MIPTGIKHETKLCYINQRINAMHLVEASTIIASQSMPQCFSYTMQFVLQRSIITVSNCAQSQTQSQLTVTLFKYNICKITPHYPRKLQFSNLLNKLYDETFIVAGKFVFAVVCT